MNALSDPQQEPFALVRQWLDEAAAASIRNPWAMSLATVDDESRPANRFVLLKEVNAVQGFIVFYTNYGSRKASELESYPRAAAALYWPQSGRQLRLEGRVTRSPTAESDAYFASRPRQSQLNAWASAQSQVLPDGGLEPVLSRLERRFAEPAPVPRPVGWGGFRIWVDVAEFWVEGAARFHERLRYERQLTATADDRFSGSDWRHVRLQP